MLRRTKQGEPIGHPKPLLAEFLTELDLRHVTLVCNDWGGAQLVMAAPIVSPTWSWSRVSEVRVAGHVTRGSMTESFRSRLDRNEIVDFRYGGDKAAGSAHSRVCNYYATIPVNDRP